MKGKTNPTTMHQVKAEVVATYMFPSNVSNLQTRQACRLYKIETLPNMELHHQESGQSIRETCFVFLSLKFTQVGPSSMISYGEVDGSSPCIQEEARCCRSAHPLGPRPPSGNQAQDNKVVRQIVCSQNACTQINAKQASA